MSTLGPRKLTRVALLVESSRTYGRGVLRGIARYAHVNGPWSFFVLERELHGGVPDALRNWHGDGIIARIENLSMARKLLRLGCPVVDVLGQQSFRGIPSFDTDHVEVARLASSFFLQAGFQHFAFIGYPGIPFSDRRRHAFAAFLRQSGATLLTLPNGTAIRPRHIQAVERQGIASERLIARWLKQQPRPLAVLACNDVCAQQVLNACRENHLRVPEDIAVVGVDNDDVLCNISDPPLTSIEPDTERLGFEAAAVLHRWMNGQPPSTPRTLIPPARLVERSSTDTVAIDDPITVAALRYIRDHIAEGIAVKDVAVNLHRSRSDLEKRFRKTLKTSVRSEILRQRINRVSRLLRETDLGLQEISARAGFATAAHLCRVFKKHFGQTPTEFRNLRSKMG